MNLRVLRLAWNGTTPPKATAKHHAEPVQVTRKDGWVELRFAEPVKITESRPLEIEL